MQIKFKKLHEKAVIPKYSKTGDAGLDLTATEIKLRGDSNNVLEYAHIKFGLAVEIPEGHVGLLFPRSSIYKTKTLLSNSVGVIDSNYRGELQAFMLGDPDNFGYKVGDRVLQLVIVPIPTIEPIEADELSDSTRGEAGFGSSGN